MILEARIAIATEAAGLLDHEAECLRMAMTLGPDHNVWPDDALAARSEHDKLINAARSLRNMAKDIQRDLDLMKRVTRARQGRWTDR